MNLLFIAAYFLPLVQPSVHAEEYASSNDLAQICLAAEQGRSGDALASMEKFNINNDFICTNGSVLAQAVRGHQTETVIKLLKAGYNPNSYARPDESDVTSQWDIVPMGVAAFYGYNDIVAILLADGRTNVNGVNLNRFEDDSFNVSPLYAAAYVGNIAAVKLLIAAPGINRGMRMPMSGKTALEIAKERGHSEIVKLLEN